MYTKTALLAVAVIFAAKSVAAADLLEVYRQARASDPQLKAAEAAYLADFEADTQGRAELLPDLSLEGSLGHRGTAPSSSVDGNSASLGVNLSQPLFDADAWYRAQSGKIESRQARLRFSDAEQSLLRRSVNAYLAVLEAKTDFSTAKAEEVALKRRLDQVRAQYEVGLIAVTDVEEARAAYDNARVARIVAKGDLDNSYEVIERLTGRSWRTLDDLKEAFPVELPGSHSTDEWARLAEKHNLALQIDSLEVLIREKVRQEADAQRYPRVDLVASLSRDNNDLSDRDFSTNSFVGINLNMPLYQGGGIDSRQRENYQRWQQAVEEREDRRREVVQSVRSLLRDLETDVQAVAARRQSIVSSETALEATEAGYNVGTRDIVDVLDAERALFAARRDYQAARYTYVRNLILFKEALGSLELTDLKALDSWLEDKEGS